jgi:hypothetical protein
MSFYVKNLGTYVSFGDDPKLVQTRELATPFGEREQAETAKAALMARFPNDKYEVSEE